MWSKLDDSLIDHQKIFAAGAPLGPNGPAIALGFYVIGLLWCCKHLTDGVLPVHVVKSFRHVARPIAIADALVQSGLWEIHGSAYQIHDFADWNPSAAKVKRKRKEDRVRKAQDRK